MDGKKVENGYELANLADAYTMTHGRAPPKKKNVEKK